MEAGRPEPVPGQHQERLGGGRHVIDRPRLYRRIQKLAGAVQGHMVLPPGRVVALSSGAGAHCSPTWEVVALSPRAGAHGTPS
jgi:hypothetical protein